MRTTPFVAIVAAIGLAACSSSASQEPTAAPPTPTAAAIMPTGAPASEPAASGALVDGTPAPSVDPDDPLGFGDDAATAVVVIGEDRYEFGNLYCVTMARALSASSVGGDPQVDISLPPPDWETSGQEWEPPSVSVDGDEPYFQWGANALLVEQQPRLAASRVDSFTSDGYVASGTATFVDLVDFGDSPAEVAGTFEVSCPGP